MKVEVKIEDYLSQEEIKEIVEGELLEIIKAKTLEVLENISEGTVVRHERWSGEKESLAHKMIDEAVQANKDAIYSRVKKVVLDYDIERFIESNMNECMEDILLSALKKGLEG